MQVEAEPKELCINFIREFTSRDVEKKPFVDSLLAIALTSTDTTTADFKTYLNTIPSVINEHLTIDAEQKVALIIREINRDPNGEIRLLRFSAVAQVRSGLSTIDDLMCLLRDIETRHSRQFQRKLLGGQFYFDQKHNMTDLVDMRGNPHRGDAKMARIYELSRAPKHLSFCKVPFSSNKTFQNLFGEEIRKIEQKVHHFIQNEQWYKEKGIPYQLGVCLHGPAGTGKTSVIGAIANLTKRHIINVHCGEIQTHTQLRRLFYEEELHVYTDNDMTDVVKVKIPIDQRLYVLEELDAMPSTLSREHGGNKQSKKDVVMNEITLAHWLQILDDVNQTLGRILVVTTNYPERLDSALMRAGRIDLNVYLGNASVGTICNMITHFTGEQVSGEYMNRIPDNKLPPAVVSNVIQQYMDLSIAEIIEKISKTTNVHHQVSEKYIEDALSKKVDSTHGNGDEESSSDDSSVEEMHSRDDMTGIHAMFA